jgi:hypothetical protein
VSGISKVSDPAILLVAVFVIEVEINGGIVATSFCTALGAGCKELVHVALIADKFVTHITKACFNQTGFAIFLLALDAQCGATTLHVADHIPPLHLVSGQVFRTYISIAILVHVTKILVIESESIAHFFSGL